MDVTSLSNSLFVSSQAAVQGLSDSVIRVTAKQQKNPYVEQSEPCQDQMVVAEQGHAADNENVQFKDTLNERTQKQDNIESDKSGESSAERTDSQENVEQTDNTKTTVRQTSVSEIITQSEALINSSRNDAEIAVAGGTEQLATNILTDGDVETDKATVLVAEQTAEGQNGTVQEKGEPQTSQLQNGIEQSESEVQQNNTDETQTNQSATDAGSDVANTEPSKQVDGENAEVIEGTQAKTSDSNDKPEGTQILKEDIEVEAKPAQQVQVQNVQTNKEQPEIEQAATELNREIKSTTEKIASQQDKSSANSTSQQNDTTEAFINTDTNINNAEEGIKSARSVSPETLDSGQQVFTKASEQIQASINNSLNQGRSEITVNLNPPELGRVVIKLQQDNGQITGLLEFSKAETKSEIQQLLPQVVRNLQDAGIAVKKLDVVQTQVDTSGQQQFRENIAGDQSAYQQQFSQDQRGSGGFGYSWVSGESAYTGAESFTESYINDQAVNVLV